MLLIVVPLWRDDVVICAVMWMRLWMSSKVQENTTSCCDALCVLCFDASEGKSKYVIGWIARRRDSCYPTNKQHAKHWQEAILLVLPLGTGTRVVDEDTTLDTKISY